MKHLQGRGQRRPERPLMSGAECAAAIGLSYPTFRARWKAGDFPPPVNRTGRPQWSRAVVAMYLRGQWRREVA